MAGAMAIGLMVYGARFLYDAFVFSTEWCVFLILMMAFYNSVMLILGHVRDAIILWVVIFIVHVLIRWIMIYTDKDPESSVIMHSARFIYDAFIFSLEWSVFLILILAIYNLVMLVLSHLQNAVIMWVLIFCAHLVLQVAHNRTMDYFNDW